MTALRTRITAPPVVPKVIALVLILLALVLFLTRYLPRQTVWPIIRLLPNAVSFMSRDANGMPNPDSIPEITALAAGILIPVEIIVLVLAGWTAWETCTALRRVPPHPFHVSFLSMILFAAWCCAALFQMWLARSYIGISALPADSIGGIILESLLIAGAVVVALSRRRVKLTT